MTREYYLEVLLSTHGRPPHPHAPDPPRHGVRAVRRPRRLDQHHAADLHEPGLRGHPPRPQPLGAGGRRRRAGGGRPGRRGVVLPGRPRGVLRVPRRVAARRGRGPRARRRRWWRRHRAEGDPAAARLRRHDLLPRGRPEDGPRRDDQLGRRRLRLRPVGRPPGHGRAGALGRPVRRRPRDHRRRGRPPRRVAARGAYAARPRAASYPCSASPAPAARASRASPTRSSAASAPTSRTSSASRSSRSTRPGARAAARCSATGSAPTPSTATACSSARWRPAARTRCPSTSPT